MTASDFILRARDLVAHESGAQFINCQPVWFGYVLGNMKAIITTIDDDRQEIYEVTYNRAKGEIYVDRYTKASNKIYEPENL